MKKNEILMQPNNLIKSRYDFTLIENKLFYKILFNAQKQSSNRPIYNAILSQDEIREFIKYRNDSTDDSIKKMLNLFQQSILEFDYIDENENLRTFGSGLINTYDINKNTMEYEITMHETLYNHITDFIRMEERGYTPLNLSVLFKFRGAYAQRFYTLFRLWSREKKEIEIKYSIKELREYLKISNDIYPAYKNFKQKVIKKSIDEINEVGNMMVSIKKEIKNGRKVDEIVFNIVDFEPRKYFDYKESEIIENKVNIGLSQDIYVNETEVIDMYIPNKKLFTSKTLKDFTKDFNNIDFKDTKYKKMLQEAIIAILDKDDTEKIYVKSYNYFKKTLENKLDDLAKKENKQDFNKTKFHNFDETFTQYEEDELERIIEQSQKEKYKKD